MAWKDKLRIPGVTLFKTSSPKHWLGQRPWKMFNYPLDQVSKAKSKCNYEVINQLFYCKNLGESLAITWRTKMRTHLVSWRRQVDLWRIDWVIYLELQMTFTFLAWMMILSIQSSKELLLSTKLITKRWQHTLKETSKVFQ